MRATGRIDISGRRPVKGKRKPAPAFRFNWGLAGAGLATLALIAMSAALLTVWSPDNNRLAVFNPPLQRISVTSKPQFVSDQEIGRMMANEIGQGFFNVEVEHIKAKLEQHPWIASAGVTRVWPDRLEIAIVEEVPIARWGKSQLLNQYGEVFTPPDSGHLPNLPVLLGPEDGQVVMMQRFKELSDILFPAGLRLQQLSLSDRGSWELVLSDGVVVVAGRKDVTERIRRFLAIYDSQIRNDIAVIEKVDLRYSNGLSVKHITSEFSGVAVR